MTNPEMGAMVVALVSLIKRAMPKLDGIWTLLVAAGATAVVFGANGLAQHYPQVMSAFAVFFGATGSVALGAWAIDRHGAAMQGASVLPPAPAQNGTTPLPIIPQSIDPPSGPKGAA